MFHVKHFFAFTRSEELADAHVVWKLSDTLSIGRIREHRHPTRPCRAPCFRQSSLLCAHLCSFVTKLCARAPKPQFHLLSRKTPIFCTKVPVSGVFASLLHLFASFQGFSGDFTPLLLVIIGRTSRAPQTRCRRQGAQARTAAGLKMIGSKCGDFPIQTDVDDKREAKIFVFAMQGREYRAFFPKKEKTSNFFQFCPALCRNRSV